MATLTSSSPDAPCENEEVTRPALQSNTKSSSSTERLWTPSHGIHFGTGVHPGSAASSPRSSAKQTWSRSFTSASSVHAIKSPDLFFGIEYTDNSPDSLLAQSKSRVTGAEPGAVKDTRKQPPKLRSRPGPKPKSIPAKRKPAVSIIKPWAESDTDNVTSEPTLLQNVNAQAEEAVLENKDDDRMNIEELLLAIQPYKHKRKNFQTEDALGVGDDRLSSNAEAAVSLEPQEVASFYKWFRGQFRRAEIGYWMLGDLVANMARRRMLPNHEPLLATVANDIAMLREDYIRLTHYYRRDLLTSTVLEQLQQSDSPLYSLTKHFSKRNQMVDAFHGAGTFVQTNIEPLYKGWSRLRRIIRLPLPRHESRLYTQPLFSGGSERVAFSKVCKELANLQMRKLAQNGIASRALHDGFDLLHEAESFFAQAYVAGKMNVKQRIHVTQILANYRACQTHLIQNLIYFESEADQYMKINGFPNNNSGSLSTSNDVASNGPRYRMWYSAITNYVNPDLEGYWTYKYYRNNYELRPSVITCTTMEQANEALSLLSHETILGLDTEWEAGSKPAHGIKANMSLIQIASESCIVLIHVARFKGSDVEHLVPSKLKTILEDPAITKAGVWIKGDCTRLEKYLGIRTRGMFELSHAYKLVKYSQGSPEDVRHIDKRLVPLAQQVEEHLGMPLKKDEDVRTSKWSQPIGLQQEEYAASDAYACYRLYHVLDEKRKRISPLPPRPQHAELDSPIMLAGDHTVVSFCKAHGIDRTGQSKAIAETAESESTDEVTQARDFMAMATEESLPEENKSETSSKNRLERSPGKSYSRRGRDAFANYSKEAIIWANGKIRTETREPKPSRLNLRYYYLWHHCGLTLQEITPLHETNVNVGLAITDIVDDFMYPSNSKRLQTLRNTTERGAKRPIASDRQQGIADASSHGTRQFGQLHDAAFADPDNQPSAMRDLDAKERSISE